MERIKTTWSGMMHIDNSNGQQDEGKPSREEVVDALLRPGRAPWGGPLLAEVARRVLRQGGDIEEIDKVIDAWTESPLFRLQELDRYCYARDKGVGKPGEFRKFERWFAEPYPNPIWNRDWRKIRALDPDPEELSEEYVAALVVTVAEETYEQTAEQALADVPESLTDDSPLRQRLHEKASQASSPGWRRLEKHCPQGEGEDAPPREVLSDVATLEATASTAPWNRRNLAEKELDRFEAREEVERRIEESPLTTRQQEILKFHYVKGLKAEEIARRLGITEGAVYAHLSNGRKRLREAF